jgi:two-component system, OmpR family, phosphate regulon sensor histidine kinase PhoR
VASVLLGLAAIALGFGFFFGPAWGFGLFSGLLLLLAVYHVRHMWALAEWTRLPLGSPLPRARGLWDLVYSDLHRRSKLAEAQRLRLSSSLEQFRDASQAMPDGVAYLSASDAIEWVNQQAERQFGLDAKRDLGAPITNLVREPDFVAFLQGGDYAQPLLFHSRRNSQSTLLIQIIPYGERQKLVLSRDITQLQRLESMRRDFVANVSHELRTPLTVIRGFLETMEDGLEEYELGQIRHFLSLAAEQAGRMQRLIDDLLSLSALETGAPEPVEEDIHVGDLLEDVRDDALLLSAGRHRIELAIGADGLLLGSRKELFSAFANLAANAVRYTPEGGVISLEWRWDGRGGMFAVRDNGIGIAAEHLPRLTERFYRVDRGRSRDSGGTGLGLAIVKHVLSRHQAQLHIDSTPGRGSCFTVRLPARRVRSVRAGE